MISLKVKNPVISPLRYPIFKNNQSDLIANFSCRKDGNMSLRYGDTANALENRKAFLGALGINYRDLICAKQVHGVTALAAGSKDKGAGALSYESAVENTDALITNEKNVPLAIFTADCLSVFIYDVKKHIIGLAHAGWRGTKGNIAGKTIERMQKQFNAQIKDLQVYFGPSMRQCCYEVGEEFKGIFSFGLNFRDSRIYLDVIAVNKKQVLDLGLDQGQIYDSGICTSCQNDEFLSFRKEGKSCARMMSVMMLK